MPPAFISSPSALFPYHDHPLQITPSHPSKANPKQQYVSLHTVAKRMAIWLLKKSYLLFWGVIALVENIQLNKHEKYRGQKYLLLHK